MDSEKVKNALNPHYEIKERVNKMLDSTSDKYLNIDNNTLIKVKKDKHFTNEKYRIASLSKTRLDDAVNKLNSKYMQIIEKSWSIKPVKIHDFSTPYGNKILIDLEAATVTNQTEYLVSFEELQRKLPNFELLSTSFMDYFDQLSHLQNKLSSMYRIFIFRKKVNIITPKILSFFSSKTVNQKDQIIVDNIKYTLIKVPKENAIIHAVLMGSSIEYNNSSITDKEKIVMNTLTNILDYIEKVYKNTTNTSLVKLRHRYPEFKTVKKLLMYSKNWKPLGIIKIMAEILKIRIRFITSEYKIVEYNEQIGTKEVNIFYNLGEFNYLQK